MGRPCRRPAGIPRRDAETLARGGVRLEQTAGKIVADGSDARAAELRHIAVAVELLVRVARHRKGQRGETGEAGEASHRRGAQPHAQRVEPPCDQQERDRRGDGNADGEPQAGVDGQQEREGVDIDDHEIEEVDRHEQNAVLELRELDQHHDHPKRQPRRRRRPPQHGEHQEIEHAPGQHERRHRHRVGLGPVHDGDRRQMKHSQDDHSASEAELGQTLLRKDGSRHDIGTPATRQEDANRTTEGIKASSSKNTVGARWRRDNPTASRNQLC